MRNDDALPFTAMALRQRANELRSFDLINTAGIDQTRCIMLTLAFMCEALAGLVDEKKQ